MVDKRARKRLGKCYTLAAEAVLWPNDDLPEGAGNVELVHGTIQHDPYPDNPHAWVEYDDPEWGCRMAWEPIGESRLPVAVYERLFNAVAHHRYTRVVASLAIMQAKHWGPWEGAHAPRQTATKQGKLRTERRVK